MNGQACDQVRTTSHSHVEISQIQLVFVKDTQCLLDCRKQILMAIASHKLDVISA